MRTIKEIIDHIEKLSLSKNDFYGKNILVMICEKYNFSKNLDDGINGKQIMQKVKTRFKDFLWHLKITFYLCIANIIANLIGVFIFHPTVSYGAAVMMGLGIGLLLCPLPMENK